ncbi:MAG: 16S rRNA (uracil(1498)-N(3))-methyltransferase [Deltaproteobacteria bacterium]|nr:16S rRNA (uracil(1498)-N(3))-methyltransferase [Deltaproteobacteria bacterium]
MNLILLEDSDFDGNGLARLGGRRARHVREVHRAQPGDELVVGRVNQGVGLGKVVASAAAEVVLEVRLDEPPPPASGIELLLAMPRPKILRRVLQATASLGIKRIVLVNSYRVEKSYFDSPLLAPEELREHLVLGLEQARDTLLPEVRVEKRFKPFVEDSLEGLWAGARRLIAHPVGGQTLTEELTGRQSERAVVAIGPEGGWIPYEVEMLEARGFARFSLGPRILRVDVAVPYVIAQLDLARR